MARRRDGGTDAARRLPHGAVNQERRRVLVMSALGPHDLMTLVQIARTPMAIHDLVRIVDV